MRVPICERVTGREEVVSASCWMVSCGLLWRCVRFCLIPPNSVCMTYEWCNGRRYDPSCFCTPLRADPYRLIRYQLREASDAMSVVVVSLVLLTFLIVFPAEIIKKGPIGFKTGRNLGMSVLRDWPISNVAGLKPHQGSGVLQYARRAR